MRHRSKPALQNAVTLVNTPIHTPKPPCCGTNAILSRTAPIPSIIREYFIMLMKMRRPPWKVLSVRPSEAFATVRNPSFLPAATLKNVIIVTNPNPPIWIRSIITA